MSTPNTDCLALQTWLVASDARWKDGSQPAWFKNYTQSCCGPTPGSDSNNKLQKRWVSSMGSSSRIQCDKGLGNFISGSGSGTTINGVPIEKFTQPRIISIEMSADDMEVSGDLNNNGAILGSLDQLMNLQIESFKGLTGPFPTWVSKLDNLAYLVLRNNSLSGQLKLYTLPSQLESLNLDQNNFSGEVQIVLPAQAPSTFGCALRQTTNDVCLGPHVPTNCYSQNQISSNIFQVRNCSSSELTAFNPPITTTSLTTTRSTTSRTTTTTRSTTSTLSTTRSTTTSTTTAAPTVYTSSANTAYSIGVIIGIVLPVLLVSFFVCICVCVYMNRRKRRLAYVIPPGAGEDVYPKPPDVISVNVTSTSTYPQQSYVGPVYGTMPSQAPIVVAQAQAQPYADPYDVAPPAYTETAVPETMPDAPIPTLPDQPAPDFIQMEGINQGSSSSAGIDPGLAEVAPAIASAKSDEKPEK